MKITPADLAFSWCVRERANWTCEKCGTTYTPPTRALQCSHYFSRDNKAVRVHPDNAFAHCAGCHSHLGSNAHIFSEWVFERYGQEKYDKLVSDSRKNATIGKMWKREQSRITKHYQKEYERMRLLRESGETGRIEFDNWCKE